MPELRDAVEMQRASPQSPADSSSESVVSTAVAQDDLPIRLPERSGVGANAHGMASVDFVGAYREDAKRQWRVVVTEDDEGMWVEVAFDPSPPLKRGRDGRIRLPIRRRLHDRLWRYTLRGFRWRFGDGMRWIPRRPCGDENHCWRCQSRWWSCGRCDGLEPDFYGVPMEGLPEGSYGHTFHLATWYHGPGPDVLDSEPPPDSIPT